MNNKLLKTTEARKLLGVSPKKFSSLLADGVLPYKLDPLDKRVKLIHTEDLERLRSVRKLRTS